MDPIPKFELCILLQSIGYAEPVWAQFDLYCCRKTVDPFEQPISTKIPRNERAKSDSSQNVICADRKLSTSCVTAQSICKKQQTYTETQPLFFRYQIVDHVYFYHHYGIIQARDSWNWLRTFLLAGHGVCIDSAVPITFLSASLFSVKRDK